MPEDEQDRGTGQEAAAQEGGISRKSFIVAAGLGAVALPAAVSAAAAPAPASYTHLTLPTKRIRYNPTVSLVQTTKTT
ncbi:hypothetical protein HUX53_38160 [Actinomadura sp. BRA 177]|nr:hypothetical protein [Actinomadura sp. BRA 177]NVI92945.1 hypothetical protein [Actinomadura sp. BRA 177]